MDMFLHTAGMACTCSEGTSLAASRHVWSWTSMKRLPFPTLGLNRFSPIHAPNSQQTVIDTLLLRPQSQKSFGNPDLGSHQGKPWVTASLFITKTSRPGVNITNPSGRLRAESGSLSKLQQTDSGSTRTDRGSSSSRMLSDGPMMTRDGSNSKITTNTAATTTDRGNVMRMVHDFSAVVGAWLGWFPWPHLRAALDVSGAA
jgi:hypothetical protein